jgi:SAM-dependent methyltransferase
MQRLLTVIVNWSCFMMINSIKHRILNRFRFFLRKLIMPPASTPPEKIHFDFVHSYSEYLEHSRKMESEYKRRQLVEMSLVTGASSFRVPGYCWICRRYTSFFVDFDHCSVNQDGQRIPNWRERLVCFSCGFQSRLRASIHVLQEILKAKTADPIYVTEQNTALFLWMKDNYLRVTGSEFLGDSTPYGTNDIRGFRNESITRLTFPDEVFSYILSFDVMEHVPNFTDGFLECLRCLKPGGAMLFSVPFDRGQAMNLVRARIGRDGEVEHLLPPEFHCDPMNRKGCLSFYTFGWELLDILKAIGFQNPSGLLFWSQPFGYLDHESVLFMAHKR